jgi:predicted phage baseplate assembly protein
MVQLSPQPGATDVSEHVVSQTTGHVLDLRDFQDIVDEARRLIPRYCPEWTDHNVSDPGITLIELFAWMTEMTLYQLNRVPDRMYERFLEMVGVQRRPPEPARAQLTFVLTPSMQRPITVPAHTAVSTDSTADAEELVFSTMAPLTISPPTLGAARVWRTAEGRYSDYLPYITGNAAGEGIFSAEPQPDDALMLGFEGDLRGYALELSFACVPGPANIALDYPPLRWEYWSSERGDWEPLVLLDDSNTARLRDPVDPDPTRGLTRNGNVYAFLPIDSEPRSVDGVEATWIRIRHEPTDAQSYDESPRVTRVRAAAIGATVEARHQRMIRDEILGESDGEPGQRFELRNAPVLRDAMPHIIQARSGEEELGDWEERDDFSASSETDRHFVIDYADGTVRFGPFIREPDGTGHQYGAAPPRDATLVCGWYRAGGGSEGNVGALSLNRLRASVPYISAVTNFRPASGGGDAESLDQAKLRARRVLRATETLVTAADFDRALRDVPGVECALARQGDEPGQIVLTVVPTVDDPTAEFEADDLAPSPELITRVTEVVDERKVLGTLVDYRTVATTEIAIDIDLFVARGADFDDVERRVERRLRTFFHPGVGGMNGEGAPFGMTVAESQIAGLVQAVPGVGFVQRARLVGEGEERRQVTADDAGLLLLGRVGIFNAGSAS